MTTPKPKLDLFTESPCLISKKCRTSTPSLRPPKPPTKSSKHARRNRGYLDHQSLSATSILLPTNIDNNNSILTPTFHDGSFSFGLQETGDQLSFAKFQNVDEYSRLYQQFEIISKIGSGHFGDVYKVRSLKDGQYYAIKKTSIPFTSNSDRSRKLQEVKNHQMLPPHPNCVKYFDSWEEDGFLYIQIELCKTSLNEILENTDEHKLPEHIVWNYVVDLLLAVKHLHDNELMHLDIKPDNIFISFDDSAKLGDFGLMCHCLDLNSSRVSKATPTTISLDDSSSYDDHDDSGIINRSDESFDSIDEGDCKYLASETMQGKFTKAADIFSLGITIFEVASGLDLPQRGEVYHKLRHNEIEDLYFNGLSADLVRIIKMMMEGDHTKRPTANDLLQLDTVRVRRLVTS